MERANRAPLGSFFAPGAWTRGDRVQLDDSAAHHAAVKRLTAGAVVRLTNGAGRRAQGEIVELSKRHLVVALADAPVDDVPARAHVELWAPVSDRDRMLMLAEKAVELGASVWRPIVYSRSRSVTPRGEGEGFREKVRLRQVSALEQCGGAWLPEMHVESSLDDALADTGVASGGNLLLDVEGESLGDIVQSLAPPVCIAVGPEGGLEDAERTQFSRAGWRLASLGDNVLRFETAGVAALAIVRSHLR